MPNVCGLIVCGEKAKILLTRFYSIFKKIYHWSLLAQSAQWRKSYFSQEWSQGVSNLSNCPLTGILLKRKAFNVKFTKIYGVSWKMDVNYCVWQGLAILHIVAGTKSSGLRYLGGLKWPPITGMSAPNYQVFLYNISGITYGLWWLRFLCIRTKAKVMFSLIVVAAQCKH